MEKHQGDDYSAMFIANDLREAAEDGETAAYWKEVWWNIPDVTEPEPGLGR